MNRRLRTTLAGICVLALLTAGAVAGVHRTLIRPAYDRDGLLVVLAVGSDVGPPERPGDPLRGRADAIHVVAVDTVRRTATVVDIPRDSMIGGTKVNAHLATGGPDALVAQLEAFTGLTIDYWVLTTFRGFERLTRALGGVDVMVDQPMHDRSSHSAFDPGAAHISGDDALAYARDRHSLADGDFGRTRHQGELLLAMHRRLADDGRDLSTLVRLVGALARNTASNIPHGDLLPLALLAADLEPDAIEQIALTGGIGTLDGASVVHIEPGATFRRINNGHVGPDT